MAESNEEPSELSRPLEHGLDKPHPEKDAGPGDDCREDSERPGQVESSFRAQPVANDRADSNPTQKVAEASSVSSLATLPVDDRFITQHGRIGSYRLREIIAEGGMGVVYLAEQNEPIRRRVALKIIKPGMDTKEVIARFEVERQALALMDHPNIARVIDGGVTEFGRPFFAMEYVKGVPLTRYCDDAKLSIRERLELFIPICQAVQHAHQKGIIHRDLKPSNILVCTYDDKPVPKVIDFGLAKAMNQSLTDKSLFTAHGTIIGTPLYMSPEQAEYNNLDIDTRSDIYSLGVILYELLTGSTPLEQAQIRQAASNEVLRLIKEFEPPMPSKRLSSSDSLLSVADQRNIDPRLLARRVCGDLDWVVMKSLDKERMRRYSSASELAEDIQRHLSDEPVNAGPPSARYRVQKFVRRNRANVLAAGFAGGVLVVALGLGVLFWAQRMIALEQLAKEQRYANVTTSLLETLVKDDYRWLSPNEQTGMAGSLARAKVLLERLGSEISPVAKCTIQNVIFTQLSAMGDHEAARDGLSAVTQELAASAPEAIQIRADAHYYLAEVLWLIEDRELSQVNFREALRLADEGDLRLAGAHYAAGFAGVFIEQARLESDSAERSRLRLKALRLIEQAEEVRDIGNDDSERAYLHGQFQRAELLSWVDGEFESGIKLLRETIKRQLVAKSRATVDALETSFLQLWSTLLETGDEKAGIEVALWWEDQARELVGPASGPMIIARICRVETLIKSGQHRESVVLLDELLEDVVRWHGAMSIETKDFVTRYYHPYMQHLGELDRVQKAQQRLSGALP